MPRLARENTLPSFQRAIDAGADGLELDVHATADGVVVVHHDDTLPTGRAIATLTFEALRASEAAPGIPIPTLREVCGLASGRVTLFVEIKGAGIEATVLEALSSYTGEAAIHSFDHELIARLSRLAPSRRLGILFDTEPSDVAESMAVTGALDVWPHWSLVTSTLVDAVHDVGGRVIPWTVNDAAGARRLVALGVDALCGDDVTVFEPA
jgi:glycerophosphoryl diester phosphodiesterase